MLLIVSKLLFKVGVASVSLLSIFLEGRHLLQISSEIILSFSIFVCLIHAFPPPPLLPSLPHSLLLLSLPHVFHLPLPFLLLASYISPLPPCPAAVLCSIRINVADINNEHVTAIDSINFMRDDILHTTLDVPLELLRMFVNDDEGLVRVTSSLFSNLSALFPDGLSTRNE